MLENLKGLVSFLFSMLHILVHKVIFPILMSKPIKKVASLFKSTNISSKFPALPNYTVISPNSVVILGLNPGDYTLQGTNTYLIGKNTSGAESEAKILIDTGEERTSAEYIKLLFDTVFPDTKTKRLSHILLTHHHMDHIGGVSAILSELERRGMLPLPVVYKRNTSSSSSKDFHNISNGQTFTTDDASVNVTALFTPGHTTDSVSFVIREDSAICTGDCVLGCGTSVFECLYTYMRSLRHLRRVIIQGSDNPTAVMSEVCEDCSNIQAKLLHIYPGHGPLILNEALKKIDEYIYHRHLREEQILAVLRKHSAHQHDTPHQPMYLSSWELVNEIYGSQNLSFIVKLSAQNNVILHLMKLEKEGMVRAKHGHNLHSRVVEEEEQSLSARGRVTDLWCLLHVKSN